MLQMDFLVLRMTAKEFETGSSVGTITLKIDNLKIINYHYH